MKKKIVLDCDGVLLDYPEAYGRICSQFLNLPLGVIDATTFYCEKRFGLNLTPGQRLDFFDYFTQDGFKNMQPLEGSVQATKILKSLGYEIIIVTSIPHPARQCRFDNLNKLGFIFDDILTTGTKVTNENPKIQYIHDINPEYFVDDLMENFYDIQASSHFVLIDEDFPDHPNKYCKRNIPLHSKHSSLKIFVQTILSNS